jgi:hypothetical protein
VSPIPVEDPLPGPPVTSCQRRRHGRHGRRINSVAPSSSEDPLPRPTQPMQSGDRESEHGMPFSRGAFPM